MTVGPDTVVKLLTAAVAASVKPFVQTIQSALTKKGLVKAGGAFGRSLQIQGPHRTGFSTLAGLEGLPPGLTYAKVKKSIDSPTFRTYATQLVAIHVLEASAHNRERIFSALDQWMVESTGVPVSPQLVAYQAKFNAALDAACEAVAGQLKRDVPQEETVHAWALGQISRSLFESIERHLAVVNSPGRASVQEAERWLTSYKSEFGKVHSQIPLFDIGPKRRVRLGEIFVKPSFHAVYNVSYIPSSPFRYDLGLSFEEFFDDLTQAVILGDPGAGKSTTTAALAVLWSRDRGAPFYLRARELSMDEAGFNLVREIERLLSSVYQRPAPAGLVEELLLNGAALVILDGLDEVAPMYRRKQIAQVVESAQRMFPLCRFLVTARLVGYSAVQLDPDVFTEFTLQPFRVDQVREYVEKWFALSSRQLHWDLKKTVDDFMRGSESIHDLRTNPLMLALVCVLYRGTKDIPRRRPEIYRRCIELLLRDWDLSRGIRVNPWEIGMYEFALSAVAELIRSSEAYRNGMTKGRLLQAISQALEAEAIPNTAEGLRVAGEIVDFCRDRGWMFTKIGADHDGEDVYSFTHRSFYEYFAAYRLTRISDSPEELAEHVFEMMKAGEGEILAQIALLMYGERSRLGTSKAMLALLELISGATGDFRSSAMEFVVAAADVVMLNGTALKKLVTLSLTVPVPHDVLRTMFLPDFRYSTGMEEILLSCLSGRNVGELVKIANGRQWLLDFFVQEGIVRLDALAGQLGESLSGTLDRLLTGAWSEFADNGPPAVAVTLLRAVADRETERSRRIAAIRGLRWLGRQAGGLSKLAGSLQNHPGSRRLNQYVLGGTGQADLAAAALTRAVGHGPEVLIGVLCLVLCICEIIESRYRLGEYPVDGVVAKLLQARSGVGTSAPEALRSALQPADAEAFDRWCGQRMSIIYYDVVRATAVS
ncbi:NACHT domain-containing protein [Micromonospora sp. NPDC005806]|uniref:NACHT domain-containing protein n=1 Tax=Micromonospora sp. NPDC005806 TaxID=3364234 RepID=UPI003687EBCB